ncbi:hypothetical protein [Streptomyces rhizosphaericus]|uniref:Uncharacterized protein n=1 Tax=Streptomyces rhizosphaericus TaxID=114699 RepID=A0A6G4A9K1_9ACTN|nr:hypothetical protein [Streptomyces rhizosphaericus]NEW69888.1 hypothetical protein [Streptomyces rhizosphaericus]
MAFSLSFNRTFKHQPWVDAVDRVAAGGDNGFNVRFQRLEADLDKISGLFTEVTAALNSLLPAPGTEKSIRLAPFLTGTGPTAWDTSSQAGLAKKPPGTSAQGAMPLTLPVPGVISSFRVFGKNKGSGTLFFDLMRAKLDGSSQDRLVRIVVSGQATDAPFSDARPPIGDPEAEIDPNAGYFIATSLVGAGNNDTVVITGFQVTYKER